MLGVYQTPGCRTLGSLGRISLSIKIVEDHILEHAIKEQESVMVMDRWGISRKIAPNYRRIQLGIGAVSHIHSFSVHPILGW